MRSGTESVDGDGFATRAVGARKGAMRPLCVLGSLRKALEYKGLSHAAQVVLENFDASMRAKDRMKHAAGIAPMMELRVVKVHEKCDTETCDFEHPTLLQVSRTHAVTVLSKLIFDHNEPEPLVLNPANLMRCIGAPYSGDVVRGYRFEPQLMKKRKANASGLEISSPRTERKRPNTS